MNKGDLVSAIAAVSGLTKRDSELALNAFMDSVEAALVSGEKVALSGFGSFEVRNRNARVGVNPQTRETIQIPAKKSPAFKAGKALKDMVNTPVNA